MNAAIFPTMAGVMVIPPIMLPVLFVFMLLLAVGVAFMLLLAVGVAFIIPLVFVVFVAFPLFMLWFAVFAGVPCMVVSPHATSKTVSSNVIAISPKRRRAFMDSFLLTVSK